MALATTPGHVEPFENSCSRLWLVGTYFCVPLALSSGVSAWTPVPTGNWVVLGTLLGCYWGRVVQRGFLEAFVTTVVVKDIHKAYRP